MSKDFTALGGDVLLKKYNNSIFRVLSTMYPEYEWMPWYSTKCPSGYWDDFKNIMKFMENLAVVLNIKEMKDWYKITSSDISNNGGSGFFHKYNHSVLLLLNTIFPAYEWLPWQFQKCPQGYWDDLANQRKFLEWAFKELKLINMSDWHTVNLNVYFIVKSLLFIFQDIIKLGGAGLLHKYNDTPSLLLSAAFPNYDWLPWLFPRSSLNTLNLLGATRFIEFIAKRLNIVEYSDWSKISPKDLIDNSRGILLVKYNSLLHLLSTLYPSVDWNNILLNNGNIWEEEDVARYYVNYLKKKQKEDIKELEYLNKFIISKRIKNSNSNILTTVLSQEFPEFKWSISSFSNLKKSQYYLKESLHTLFQGEDILEEYRHPDLLSKYPLELDFFIPKYNIAFEYQVNCFFYIC